MASERRKFGCKEDLIALVVIFIVVFFMLFPGFRIQRGYRRSARISCTSNLKQIGLSLKQYAMDYNDFFPPENNSKGLDKLRELDYLTDYRVYTCPEKKYIRGKKGPITEANCGYVYLGGFKEGGYADTPLAFDKPHNHSDYFNVLYLDGHVRGYSAVTGNCEDIINFLNVQHRYSPELLKKLLSKAKKIDAALPKI